MASTFRTAARAVGAAFALSALLAAAGCDGLAGTSPPHAAPPFPSAEAGDGFIDLSWGTVPGASRYSILWTDGTNPGGSFNNTISNLTTTSFHHDGLTNFRTYRYRIVAETSGGRGPESLTVSAEPGPLPGPVEWAVVTSNNPGHTIHFASAALATSYRIYIASTPGQLVGRRPNAGFDVANASPHQRPLVLLNSAAFYRVIAMNGTRIGFDGPVVMSPTHTVTTFNLPRAGAAVGRVNADACLDTPTALGNVTGGQCDSALSARVLADVGLGDLLAAGRTNGDSRFADFTGDEIDDLFSNTFSAADDPASIALMHVNQGTTGNFQTSAGVSALSIGGFGGTVLAADFNNDGDVDLFAPNDHTRGDGARNWLLDNDGTGVFTDRAVAAGVATNPAGAAFVPRGGQAVDFNEDGFVDLLFGSRLLLNDGSGNFTDGSAAAGMPVRADQGLKLSDADLDGDLDLFHHDGAVTRLHRNTAGVFDAGQVVNEDTTQATFGNGLNICDFNSDGFEDLLVAYNVTATGIGVPKLFVNRVGDFLPTAVQRELVAGSNDLVALNDLIACGDLDGNATVDILSRWGTTYRTLRAALSLPTRIRVRVLGAGGERNQQGRIVRVTPRSMPNRILTRVIESGSGLQSQSQYDLIVGSQWLGTHDIAVRFGAGTVTATAEPGDDLTIFSDGRVVDGLQ